MSPRSMGIMTTEISFSEMMKVQKRVPVKNRNLLWHPLEEEANQVGVVGGSPGGGGGGGGGGSSLGPVQGSPSGSGGGGPSLGPIQGGGGGGGMGPGSGGQWVPTTPLPTSAEVNRGGGDGGNNWWGVSGWGWPYYGYGWPYYGYGYGYPYGYGYGYPQQPQGMVCQQSEDDPKKFVCEPQYPQYQRARAYTWAPPFWGW